LFQAFALSVSFGKLGNFLTSRGNKWDAHAHWRGLTYSWQVLPSTSEQ